MSPQKDILVSAPWARPHTDEYGETMAQLLAVLAVAGRPLPITTAREVAAFCLQPSLLLSTMSAREAEVWARNIGTDARTPPGDDPFPCWGRAVASLRGRGRLVEDGAAGTWASGDMGEVEIEGWPRERATFVLRALDLLLGTSRCDQPLAMPHLISYRYRGSFGWIMIGARSHGDALAEASRSTDEPITKSRLQVWQGTRYVDVHADVSARHPAMTEGE